MGKRIGYLDFLKFIAIFSVLLGHSCEQLSGGEFWDHPLWSFIYAYHMPLFMFISGYFFPSSLNRPFRQMLSTKLRQLGIPCLTAYAACCVLMLLMGTTAIADLTEWSWQGFMNTVWFLKCVLLCYLVMYVLLRAVPSPWAASILATVLVLLVPGGDLVNLNFLLPCFCLGFLASRHAQSLARWRLPLALLFGSAFLLLLGFWSGRLTVYMVPTRLLDWTSWTLDTENLRVTLLRLLLGASGSLFLYLVAEPVYGWLSSWSLLPVLLEVGGATLGIYVLQTFFLEILIHCLGLYVPIPWSYVASPVLAVLETALCCWLVAVLRRHPLAALLVLGQRRQGGR